MAPEAVSAALLAAAPHVGRVRGRALRRDATRPTRSHETCTSETRSGASSATSRRSACSGRTQGKPGAERGLTTGEAADDRQSSLRRSPPVALRRERGRDEELAVSRATLLAPRGGRDRSQGGQGRRRRVDRRAPRARVRRRRAARRAAEWARQRDRAAAATPTDAENAALIAFALDAVEAWLAARRADHDDPAHRWPSLHAPRTSTTTTSSSSAAPTRTRARSSSSAPTTSGASAAASR